MWHVAAEAAKQRLAFDAVTGGKSRFADIPPRV